MPGLPVKARVADGAALGIEPAAGGRIVFANQLCGIAALSVVLAHLGGVFVVDSTLVSEVTSLPPVQAGHPAILLLTGGAYVNLGALGVAVFFLISGFVIPFSLRSQRPVAFLVARTLRIMPTFWAALAVEWLLVKAQSISSGHAMAFGIRSYIANALLIDTVIGGRIVDLVNWTLAIEVKFYLLMALMRPWLLRGWVLPFLGVGLAAVAIAAAQQHGLRISPYLAVEPMYIAFMLVGTVFHMHLVGWIGSRQATAIIALLGLLVLSAWALGPLHAQVPALALNYLYALGLFTLLYAARRHFRPWRWLDRLADISYPLYLVHSVVDYSVMALAMRGLGLGYWGALPVGLAVVLLLATVLHVYVERPGIARGRQLAARLSRPGRVLS